MFQTESVLSSIIRIFHSETVQTEEGATVFFKGIPDYFSGYFSVCLFYVLSSNMASGSVTLPEWASGADVGLAVLPGYATVTGLQTLAWFNLVRASTPPPLPASVPRLKFHARPPGSCCVRHRLITKTFRECFQSTQRSRRPSSLVSPQRYVKSVLLLDTRQSSLSLVTGAYPSDEGIIHSASVSAYVTDVSLLGTQSIAAYQQVMTDVSMDPMSCFGFNV